MLQQTSLDRLLVSQQVASISLYIVYFVLSISLNNFDQSIPPFPCRFLRSPRTSATTTHPSIILLCPQTRFRITYRDSPQIGNQPITHLRCAFNSVVVAATVLRRVKSPLDQSSEVITDNNQTNINEHSETKDQIWKNVRLSTCSIRLLQR